MFSVIISKLYKYFMKKLLGKRLYRFRIIKLIYDYAVTLLPKDNFEINGFKFNNNSGNLLLTEISNSKEISFCNKQIQKNYDENLDYSNLVEIDLFKSIYSYLNEKED